MTENTEQHSNLSPTNPPAGNGQASNTMSKSMKYYDLKKNWHRVKPHLGDKQFNDILVRDFNKFTSGRWNKTFTYGDLPYEFKSCDWDCDHRGRRPAFWQYVKHAACHWLVNSSLCLAMLVQPKKRWRIITSLMAMIAYAFLQHRRLKKVRRGKKNQRPAPSTDVAGGSPRHRRPHHAIKSSAMSVLPILDQRGKAA